MPRAWAPIAIRAAPVRIGRRCGSSLASPSGKIPIAPPSRRCRSTPRTCGRSPPCRRLRRVLRAMDRQRAAEPEERAEHRVRNRRAHREEADRPRDHRDQERRVDEPAVVVGHQQHGPGPRDPLEAGHVHRAEPARGGGPRDPADEPVGESPHPRIVPPLRWRGGQGGRFGAACGILGPAAFTAAWLIAQRRQDEYEVQHEHISGLAARDAKDPLVMTAGFVALGACGVAFASAVHRRFGPDAGWGPALLGRRASPRSRRACSGGIGGRTSRPPASPRASRG